MDMHFAVLLAGTAAVMAWAVWDTIIYPLLYLEPATTQSVPGGSPRQGVEQ